MQCGYTSTIAREEKDPGFPTIRCSIGAQNFDKALCDLGASVSVMPKVVFDQLNYTKLTPTPMQLQLADSSVRHPEGIADDVPVTDGCFWTRRHAWHGQGLQREATGGGGGRPRRVGASARRINGRNGREGVGGGAVGGVGGENRAGRWEMEIRAILQLPKIPGTKL